MIEGQRLCTCSRPVLECPSCRMKNLINPPCEVLLKTRLKYCGPYSVYISFLLRYNKYWNRGNCLYPDEEEHSVDEWYSIDLLELLEILKTDQLYVNDEKLTESNPHITCLTSCQFNDQQSIVRVLTYNQKTLLVIEESRIFARDRLWSSARYTIDLTDIFPKLSDAYYELKNTLFFWDNPKCEEIQWEYSNQISSLSSYYMFSDNFKGTNYYYCHPKTILLYYSLKMRTMWDVYRLFMQNSNVVDEVQYDIFTIDKIGIKNPDYTCRGKDSEQGEYLIAAEEDVETVIERLSKHIESHSRPRNSNLLSI